MQIYGERCGEVTRLIIQDNGIGMNPHDQATVFSMFHRLRDNEYPGTRIGLTIVRKVVERMGGTVGLDSKPGHGTRFWLELPPLVE